MAVGSSVGFIWVRQLVSRDVRRAGDPALAARRPYTPLQEHLQGDIRVRETLSRMSSGTKDLLRHPSCKDIALTMSIEPYKINVYANLMSQLASSRCPGARPAA